MLVDMEELPRDVAGVLVVKRGVTVLWLVVDVDVCTMVVAGRDAVTADVAVLLVE